MCVISPPSLLVLCSWCYEAAVRVVWSKGSTVVGSNGSREAQGFYRLIWKV